MQSITFKKPVDYHLHLRDGEIMEAVLLRSMRFFSGAIVMPNLKPPVRTWREAEAYRDRILKARDGLAQAHGFGHDFMPFMTCYLTDDTKKEDLLEGWEKNIFAGVKLYPSGATTNSQMGVTHLDHVGEVLACMEEAGIPLLIHGEVTDSHVDIFDREAVFIQDVLRPLVQKFPKLRIVLEHITTKDAADFIMSAPDHVVATVTPQHLVIDRNDLLVGGVKPHFYCLPIVKKNVHMKALKKAVTSGSHKFFPGTDSAPHLRHTKETSCGCAGIFNADAALSVYLTVFEEEEALSHWHAFVEDNGKRFYGFDILPEEVTWHKETMSSPQPVHVGDDDIEPFFSPKWCGWSLAQE